ncbi:hypothetical protein [Kordia sp.]|uniref:hypothetical protein n=1 Tax=Kordia sp. TaxID=1965332 RepID=UPI003D2D88B5
MKKPNLVIDKEQKKVFLEEKHIGNIINNDEVGRFHLEFEEVNKLSGLRILDVFNEKIYQITILFEESFYYRHDSIFTYFTAIDFWVKNISYINIHLSLNNWDFRFGINSFLLKLIKSLSDVEFIYIDEGQFEDFEDVLKLGLRLYLSEDAWTNDIYIFHNEIVELLNRKIDNIFLELTQEISSNNQNLSNTFTFPPEIQSSCEQYLIYFATFLKDIGINAETNIESKTHETLFTVIPENGEEALDKIKEALQVYLSLPESPEFESAVSEFPDVGVQQLASQVLFLKSQLMMANSAIQMKDATIKSLNMTNYQQNVIIDSHQTKKENEEELVGNLVKTSEIKVPGLTFNLPEILRRIKRKFT